MRIHVWSKSLLPAAAPAATAAVKVAAGVTMAAVTDMDSPALQHLSQLRIGILKASHVLVLVHQWCRKEGELVFC
jgi:hypothetical protein